MPSCPSLGQIVPLPRVAPWAIFAASAYSFAE
jgi:hypothetical protein